MRDLIERAPILRMTHAIAPHALSFAGRDISDLPPLLIPDELAALLRTSRKSIYAQVERGRIPGVLRIGTRLLFDRDAIRDWLDRGCPTAGARRS